MTGRDDLTLEQRAVNDETWRHIHQVQTLLMAAIQRLQERLIQHDQTKLAPPEVALFAEYTPRLRGCTYGSEEYRSYLQALRPALEHHYAHNSHHPEHYSDGIEGMDLLDLLEMLADWTAATMRHADGDLRRSFDVNRKRFGIGDQLLRVLENTAERMGWLPRPE